MNRTESDRTAALLQAQSKANELFHAVEARGLIRANVLESQVNQDIDDLAEEMFGISTYWHKRIVRAGPNTLAPYEENPSDLTVGEDDILFLDLGPAFEEWEADFGRTFVLGSNAIKLKLRDDIGRAFTRGKEYFNAHPDTTAAELAPVFVGSGESLLAGMDLPSLGYHPTSHITTVSVMHVLIAKKNP